MINELKVGDWMIGPPLSVPTKIKELKSTAMFVGRILGQDEDEDFYFDDDDRIATPTEISAYFLDKFIEVTPEETRNQIEELNDGEMNLFYDTSTDAFYLNGFVIFHNERFVLYEMS